MKNKMKFISVLFSVGLILVLFGVTYSFFNFTASSNELVTTNGQVYMKMNKSNTNIVLNNVFPESYNKAKYVNGENGELRTDNIIEFTITGKNDYEESVYYEIDLEYGSDVNNKTRIDDKYLKFELYNVTDNIEIIEDCSYDTISSRKIHVDTISNTDINYSKTYRLRMWYDEKIIISDTESNADFKASNNEYQTENSSLPLYTDLFASVKVKIYGDFIEKNAPKNLYNKIKSEAVLDSVNSTYVSNSINYNDSPSDTNGKGIYILDRTKDDDFPVYYYRGNIDNNNVIFGGACWKIVRTTDTGGIKVVYSGVPTDNVCNNSDTNGIGFSVYNSLRNSAYSLSDVGYYYGSRYPIDNDTYMSSKISESYFGNNVTYSNGEYVISNPTYFDRRNNNLHYSCLDESSTGRCSEIYYVFYRNPDWRYYYIKLNGGKMIEDAVSEMLSNSSNSIPSDVATLINNWYADNLVSLTDKIEDTVYCNNREVYDSGGWNINNSIDSVLLFKNYNNPSDISFTCPKNDSFTVNNTTKGNGVLTYPIGLLTINEVYLLGQNNIIFNKNLNGMGYTLSPSYIADNFPNPIPSMFYALKESSSVNQYGISRSFPVAYQTDENIPIYPVISLKNTINFIKGDGTLNNPYVIE